MSRNKLSRMMYEDLPNITYQRKLKYRTSRREVSRLFNLLNRQIFNSKLPTPKFEVKSHCRDYWGACSSDEFLPKPTKKKSNCTIKLSNKWYCKQWLISVLAHEMCHQYQWDIISLKRMRRGLKPIMSHGPTFFMHKKKLARYGIPLKTSVTAYKWFIHQDFFKC